MAPECLGLSWKHSERGGLAAVARAPGTFFAHGQPTDAELSGEVPCGIRTQALTQLGSLGHGGLAAAELPLLQALVQVL